MAGGKFQVRIPGEFGLPSEMRDLVENAGVVWVGWSLDGQKVYYRALDSERGTSFWSVDGISLEWSGSGG